MLLLAVLFALGCGDPRPAGMPKLYPASMVVTLEGQPLEGAMILLHPEDAANAPWGPAGQTDSSGIAELRTNARYDGAPLGEYKVVVTKIVMPPHPHPEWENLPEGDPNRRKYIAIQDTLRPIEIVDPKYGMVSDTPLRVEITAKGKTYPVEVKTKL